MKSRHSRQPSRACFLCAGMLLGVIIQASLFLYFSVTSHFGYLGQESAKAKALVEQHYLADYLIYNLKLFSINAVVGILVGLVGCFVAATLLSFANRKNLLWVSLIIGLLNFIVLVRSVLLTPQLYWEVYADQGIAARLIDIALDYATPVAINIVLLCIALLTLSGLKRMFGWRTVVIICSGLLVVVGWLSVPGKLADSNSKSPNVVLIVVDSLRSDRLSGLGYQRKTTQNIDELMTGSDVFPNTYVSLPRTLPSVVSMLTGQLPIQHGIRTMFPVAAEREKDRTALPHLFREKGYTTAVVSDYAGEMFHDVDLGYQVIKAPSFNFPAIYRQRSLEIQFLMLAWLNNSYGRVLLPELELLPQNADPEILTDRALRVAEDLPQPFFLTVFYSATHFPYTAPYPDYFAFSSPDYRGPYRFAVPYFVEDDKGVQPEDLRQVGAVYDGALRSADRAIGRLLDRLGESGLLQGSTVVLTGDHGENLYENAAGFGHGDHFVGGLQSVRVPLLVKRAGQTVQKVDMDDVRITDLLPTLAEVLDLDMSGLPAVDGLSIYVKTGSPRQVYAETGLWMSPASTDPIAGQYIEYPDILSAAEVDFDHNDEVVIKKHYRNLVRTAKHRLYKKGPWALVYMPTRKGVLYKLFNTAEDPAFQVDLAKKFPKHFQDLRSELLDLMADEPGVFIRNDFAVYENN